MYMFLLPIFDQTYIYVFPAPKISLSLKVVIFIRERHVVYSEWIFDDNWIQEEIIIFIVDKKTLSVGVIAGVTVSACVLGILIGAAAIYCIKFRRARAPFDHSSFENSIQTIQNFEST